MNNSFAKWISAISLKQPNIREVERALKIERLTALAQGSYHVTWWAGDNIMFRINPTEKYAPTTQLISAYFIFRSDFFKVDVNVRPVDVRPLFVNEVSLDTSAGEFARKMSEAGLAVNVEHMGVTWGAQVERAFSFVFINRDNVPDLESASYSHIEYFFRAPVTSGRSKITFSV